MSYSATDVVGLTLYAKTNVDIKDEALDDAPVIRTVPAGGMIGVVWSWAEPRAGRTNMHWSFLDVNGQIFYAEHKKGRFNLDDLRDQGLLTEQEQNQEPLSNFDKAINGVLRLGALIAFGKLAQVAIKKYM